MASAGQEFCGLEQLWWVTLAQGLSWVVLKLSARAVGT